MKKNFAIFYFFYLHMCITDTRVANNYIENIITPVMGNYICFALLQSGIGFGMFPKIRHPLRR